MTINTNMNDKKFWQELCPELTIAEDSWRVTPIEVPVRDVGSKIVTDGYFHESFNHWGTSCPLEDMAKCIERIKALDMHPVWCFVYDEFWFLTTRIHSYIKSVLGSRYRKLPEMWAWHVDPAKQERGWAIHRDRGPETLFEDGTPKALSIWIPLTDTNVENGCIHVVPAYDDIDYKNSEYTEELHDPTKAVALPAKAGDVLGWTQQLLHWGGETINTEAPPRISISVEFVAGYVELLDDQPFRGSFLNPFIVPCFEEKTEIILNQIKQYEHMWNSK